MTGFEKNGYRRLRDVFSSRRAGILLGILAFAALTLATYTGVHYFKSDTVASKALPDNGNSERSVSPGATQPAKKLWVCPMHPEIVRDKPGTCPICGMDLVEMQPAGAAHDEHSDHTHDLHLDNVTLQKLGVRLATVERKNLSRDLHSYGNVAIDQSLVFNVSSKVEGVIRKLYVATAGQPVQAGQVLYEIYSPDLLQTQREYIELLRQKDKFMSEMMKKEGHTSSKPMPEKEMEVLMINTQKRIRIREKILYADTGEELISEIERTYKPQEVVAVRATQSGFVTQIDAREGSTVKPMDNLFSIADLSKVWIEIALYPDQFDWVKNGDAVSVKLPPPYQTELKGRLQLISSLLDEGSRTARAKLTVANPKKRLRPGAYVDVTIHAEPHQALAVPRSAVIRTGKGDWVMLSHGSGYFAPAKVETGIETAELIEITAGLQAGDQVAVNGQFLLDAAASLSDTAQRMQPHQTK